MIVREVPTRTRLRANETGAVWKLVADIKKSVKGGQPVSSLKKSFSSALTAGIGMRVDSWLRTSPGHNDTSKISLCSRTSK